MHLAPGGIARGVARVIAWLLALLLALAAGSGTRAGAGPGTGPGAGPGTPTAPALPAAGKALPSALRVPGPLAERVANYRIAADLDTTKHNIVAREHLEWHNTQSAPAD